MKTKANLFLSVILLTMVACSHQIYGTVLPQADGTYRAIGSGKQERSAYKMVETDATTTCKKDGYKSFYSIDQKSEYVGPKLTDGEEKGFSGMTLTILEAAAKYKTKENYKVEMVFKCQ